MYQAFYRKWRPQVFDDVCGQEHITSILKYETENSKFSHAYLFCGSRGTGKTTCAKILAKAVNCESPVGGNPCNRCAACRSIDEGTATDVLEMDAASNNGVDNIRDIRDEVVYTPSALKYRVYIVDEVHMLSASAFNALLKTLEEPPAHAIFILATTELHKLPSTIVSRCQRYDFRRIGTDYIVGRLAHIAESEGVEYSADALRIIAKMAQGGMRDAISLLELCAGNREKITAELVNSTLGVGGRESAEQVARAIAAADFDTVFGAVDSVVRSSKDLSVFWQDLLSLYRDMLVIKTTRSAKEYLDLTDDETERLRAVADLFTKEALLYHSRILDESLYAMQKAGNGKRTVAEMALVRMCDNTLDASVDALMARISKLEDMLLSGSFAPSAPAATKAIPKAESKKEAAPKPEAAEEKKQEAQKPNAAAAVAPSAKGELRLIRGWTEVIQRATVTDLSMVGFLKMSKAFVDGDGRVQIRFSQSFAKDMVERSGIRGEIRGALCHKLGRQLAESDVVYGLLEGGETVDELDEFNI